MQRLSNTVQRYAWGSPTALSALLGVEADGQPQAELWMGAHPAAPSRLADGRTLLEYLSEAPAVRLGAAVARRFGGELPFLFKVLAAAKPLSLQAHPSETQARAGFEAEERQGLARSAPNRLYKDPHHKPELLCALTPFTALCGFRADQRLLEVAGLGALELSAVMRLPRDEVKRLCDVLRTSGTWPGFELERHWTSRLLESYGDDVGVIASLFLNLITLAPNEALALGPGVLHAYLEGTGVELMANSDNVLRGGLTPKHVDVEALLSVLRFDAPQPSLIRAVGSPEAIYETPFEEFQLSRIELDGQLTLPAGRPSIVLVTRGSATVNGLHLERGASVFVDADEALELAGKGQLFRAAPGLAP